MSVKDFVLGLQIDRDRICDINHKAKYVNVGDFAHEKAPALRLHAPLSPQEGDRTAAQRHAKADYQSTAGHPGC